MQTAWQGRMVQAAGRYGEHAPMAAVCCNACRTCVTTNVLGVALAGVVGAGAAVVGFVRTLGQTVEPERSRDEVNDPSEGSP